MDKNEKYIMVYNCFVNSKEDSNEYHLSTSELETYMMIEKEKRFLTEEYIISVDTMLVLNNKKVNKRNRKQVKDDIESLETKGIIEIVEQGVNHYIIHPTYKEFKGYEELYLHEIETINKKTNNDAKLLHLYSLVKVREMKEKDSAATLAYSVIADILDISEKTAVKYVKQLEDLKLIKIKKYTKDNKKQTNKIFTTIKKVKGDTIDMSEPETKEIDISNLESDVQKEKKQSNTSFQDFLKQQSKKKNKESLAQEVERKKREREESAERSRSKKVQEEADKYFNNNESRGSKFKTLDDVYEAFGM